MFGAFPFFLAGRLGLLRGPLVRGCGRAFRAHNPLPPDTKFPSEGRLCVMFCGYAQGIMEH